VAALERPPKKIPEEEHVAYALRKAQDELASVSTDDHVVELYRGRMPLFSSKAIAEGGSLEEASASFRQLSELVFRPLFRAKIPGDAPAPAAGQRPPLVLVHSRKERDS
jgi:hypothetical protein